MAPKVKSPVGPALGKKLSSMSTSSKRSEGSCNEESSQDCVTCRIVFRSESESCSNKVHINSRDMKTLGVTVGSMVLLRASGSHELPVNIWPSKSIPHGNVSVSRIWKAACVDDGRETSIRKAPSRYAVLFTKHSCEKITL